MFILFQLTDSIAVTAYTATKEPQFQTNREPPTSQIPNIRKEAQNIQGTTTYDIQKLRSPNR
jgi:hypothetical protein